MSADAAVDADALREEVKSKYREVAVNPTGIFHFHTGRALAKRWDTTTAWWVPCRMRRWNLRRRR